MTATYLLLNDNGNLHDALDLYRLVDDNHLLHLLDNLRSAVGQWSSGHKRKKQHNQP